LSYAVDLVLAAGTGLGVGLLTHQHGASDFHVLPLEGGHMLLNTVGVNHALYAEEQDLLQFVGRKLYDGKYTLEFEDFVSGRGVLALYNWTTKDHPEAEALSDTAQGIAIETRESSALRLLLTCDKRCVVAKRATAEPPCPFAKKALLLHYQYLMRAAQNLAIGMNVKGVFLAGDNQVFNRDFVVAYVLHDCERCRWHIMIRLPVVRC
jgi:glucokinase